MRSNSLPLVRGKQLTRAGFEAPADFYKENCIPSEATGKAQWAHTARPAPEGQGKREGAGRALPAPWRLGIQGFLGE